MLDVAAKIAILIGLNVLLIYAFYGFLWAMCLKIRDLTVVDSFWAFGMTFLGITSFLLTDGYLPRRLLLVGICTAWGLRLGLYMLWRWKINGPDRRYVRMMEKAEAKRGWSFAKASWRLVFRRQALVLCLVCLPVQLGQIAETPAHIGVLGTIGAAIAIIGLLFETIADWQLINFRKNEANRGQVLRSGLWRYTRHPNYFGDACVWWGLWLIGAETLPGLLAIFGPLYLVWTLTQWSGAPSTEGRMQKTRPEYADYIRTTSGFFPWFPKRSQLEANR